MTDNEFEQAVHTYGDMVYRVACHAVKSRPDAEDVTQTVFLRLCEYRGAFDGADHLKHWLLRVAVNESRRLLGSFWRRRAVPLDEEWDMPILEDPDKRDLLRAVMGLERKYRLTIYLYYYEGCSVKEVAAALRANPSTVQTWLQRARDRLRQVLADEEEEEGNPYVQPQIVP